MFMKKWFVYSLLFIFGFLILLIILLKFTDAGHDFRKTVAATILSSQHRSLAWVSLLPQNELNEMLKNIENPAFENLKPGDIKQIETDIKTIDQPAEQVKTLHVKVESIEKKYSSAYYYKGKMMTVDDPKAIRLVSSKAQGMGQQIDEMAREASAIAAINASGFVDQNGRGNGGAATGIVIENGKITNTPGGADVKSYVAALTKQGVFVTGFYSANELIDLGVKDAAGFKPQLIVSGKKMVTDGDGGWGIGPRTAIGQKKDGSIVMVVIDGRQSHSIGATIKEVQDILYDQGVINAMCMDGGSSAGMYFNGENITTPSSVGNIPRYLPNEWIVSGDGFPHTELMLDGNIITSK
jgi:exopolysaccharide biosynthesis protein